MSNNPIFIMAPGRSGSTLMATLLNTHSKIAIFPETWIFHYLDYYGCMHRFLSKWQLRLLSNDIYNSVKNTDVIAADSVKKTAAEFRGNINNTLSFINKLGQNYANSKGASMWGEKTPPHLFELKHITQLFPDAYYIRLIRDPRDILASYINTWGQNHQQKDIFLKNSAALIYRYITILLYSKYFKNTRNILIRYEDLVSKPDEVFNSIFNFLDLHFEKNIFNFKHSDRALALTSKLRFQNLSKPIQTSSIGKYKNAFDGNIIKKINILYSKHLKECGYHIENNIDNNISGTKDIYEWVNEIVAESKKIRKGSRILKRRIRGYGKVFFCILFGGKSFFMPNCKFNSIKDWGNK